MQRVRPERRHQFRRPLRKPVHCYIEGTRLEAVARDINLGGLFLETAEFGPVPMGALVALVFQGGEGQPQSVHLFGRVVRAEESPRPGVGLRWEKAVTAGDPAVLVEFLAKLFLIDRDTIRLDETRGARGEARHVFRFSRLLSRPAVPAEAPARPVAPVPRPHAPREDWRPVGAAPEIDEVEVRVLRNRPDDAPSLPSTMSRFAASVRAEAPGELVPRSAPRAERIPVSLDATLVFDGARVPSRLRQIGAGSIFAETRLMPVDASRAAVDVKLDVATPAGRVPITCRCRVLSADPGTRGAPGLDLAIEGVDEGAHPGLFQRYLKWLHFRSTSTT